MQTLEALQRKIQTSGDLLSVVKTMKSLAAVNIRQYESAAAALDQYYDIVEKGWQALFLDWGHQPHSHSGEAAVCLVLGSDQGMCGQFNDVVLERAFRHAGELESLGQTCSFWAAGERVLSGLADGSGAAEFFSLPSSISGIGEQMNRIVETFATWRQEKNTRILYVIHNRQEQKAMGYHPAMNRVLPLDREWLAEKREVPWPSRCIPMLGLPEEKLFDHLLHQYLFASFFRAFAQSMASENAARLAAMQSAEKNILEMRERLQGSYREARQNLITSELFDIISGFEAIME
ncbi:MAG: F0F1 ATP synthase subunit gamma [Desulfobulbaceae bacterium]|nr:F0F1 ATP synthase subunit gamma [Desulfobulbaceae bacterium]